MFLSFPLCFPLPPTTLFAFLVQYAKILQVYYFKKCLFALLIIKYSVAFTEFTNIPTGFLTNFSNVIEIIPFVQQVLDVAFPEFSVVHLYDQ